MNIESMNIVFIIIIDILIYSNFYVGRRLFQVITFFSSNVNLIIYAYIYTYM